MPDEETKLNEETTDEAAAGEQPEASDAPAPETPSADPEQQADEVLSSPGADEGAAASGDQPAEDQPAPEAAETEETDQAEAPAEGEAGAAEEQEEQEEPLVTPGMDWFVLRVASNKEDFVKETLLRKVRIEGLTHMVNRILVPTEKIKTMKGGKQRVREQKLYPGYVFVEMKLEPDGRIPQDVFFLIKETTGVGDFIGTTGRPAPMQLHEVEKMIQASKRPDEEPEVKMEFQPGDPVKIKEGPFENMDGSVDALLPDQGKVRVIVTIFGRSTPVEMEYWLIEKADQ